MAASPVEPTSSISSPPRVRIASSSRATQLGFLAFFALSSAVPSCDVACLSKLSSSVCCLLLVPSCAYANEAPR